MKEILILGFAFTFPAWFIIIRNFLWDLSFWQKKNYSAERFSLNILWDLDKDKTSHFLIFVKFIALAFLTIGFQYFLSGILAIGGLLILWSFEAFWRLELVFLTKEPRVTLSKPRNLISLLSFIALILYIFLWVTLPFVFTVDTASNVNFQMQLSYGIPSAYIYLLIITSIFCLLDLTTSLVVALQQILINQIALLKRKIKLFLFQDSVSKLRASNLVVLYLGDSSTQLGKLFIAGLPNGKALDIYDPNQLNEFILDNKLKEKVIFVNCNNDFKYSFNTIVPEILVINSQDLNLKDVLQSIPTRTKVVANIDFVAESEITKYHKGEYSLFSGKHHNSSKSGSLITTKYIESEAKGLRVTYSVKGEELTVFLKTLNREYITSYSAFIAVLKELEIDTNKVTKEVERSLPLLSKSIFIEGDNNTKILSFEYQELSYKDFAKNIGSAARHKGQNKLIVITNGLGRKNIPEEFFELAKADADVFITNDQYFNRQLNKRGIRNYHADSFKNAAYLARKYSKEGDIFLIEGVFKDSIIKLLKKN